MSIELLNALQMVADERSIPIDEMVKTIESAVAMAACNRLGRDNISATFDLTRGEFDLFETLEVVELVKDTRTNISLEEAKEIDPSAENGSKVLRIVEMKDLGRIAAQSVRKMIHLKGEEIEQHRIFDEYEAKIGQIVTGRFIKKVYDLMIFSLGNLEAVLPLSEQLENDKFYRGRHVKLLLIDVEMRKKDPTAIVSRNRSDLLRLLLEMENPDIAEGHVEIVALARDTVGRSKIAVKSKKHGVDPVGSCVGVRGERIQAVVKELSGEKIDIFKWEDDPSLLIASALTPAKTTRVTISFDGKRGVAIVPKDQLSPAIGKRGTNVKLATMISGLELDVISKEEYDNLQKKTNSGQLGKDANQGRDKII